MAVRHLDIRVEGIVQGVGFRYSTRAKALALGVTGIALNEPDGSVLIEAEGEPDTLDLFLAWCRRGPPGARVTGLSSHPGPLKGFDSFRIVH